MDEKEFQAFYGAAAPGLWAYLTRLTGDRELAADILQDAFVRWNLRAPSDLAPPAQKAYLYRIATNLVTDHARRSRKMVFDDNALDRAETTHIDIALKLDMDQALRKMSGRHRALLWLAYAEDYTHEEIGTILNVKTRSVKVLLHRARKKLTEILQEMEIRRTS